MNPMLLPKSGGLNIFKLMWISYDCGAILLTGVQVRANILVVSGGKLIAA